LRLAIDIYNERKEMKKILTSKGYTDETAEDILSNCYLQAVTGDKNYDPNHPRSKSYRVMFVLGRAYNLSARKTDDCMSYVKEVNYIRSAGAYVPNYKEFDIYQILHKIDATDKHKRNFMIVLENGPTEAAKITNEKFCTVKKQYESVLLKIKNISKDVF
jgi:hypothetical protein